MTNANAAHRRISEIQADLRAAKRALHSLLRCAGDDFGIDGTREEAASWRGWIESYTNELADARAARAARS